MRNGFGVDVDLEQAEIRALVNRMAHSWNQRKLHLFMKGYLYSPDVIFVAPDQEPIVGYQQIRNYFGTGFHDISRNIGTLRLASNRIDVSPDLKAAGYFQWELSMDSSEAINGVTTFFFKKIHEEWSVVYMHSS